MPRARIGMESDGAAWLKSTGTKNVLIEEIIGGDNLIPNGGGPDTTDWTNPTDGLANGWSKYPGSNNTATIVTGNGFTGNAQRCVVLGTTSASSFALLRPDVSIEDGVSYTFSFKYRSSMVLYYLKSDGATGYYYNWDSWVANTGNAVYASGNFTGDSDTDSTFLFIVGVPIGTTHYSGDWFEIDEVYVYET